MTKFYILIQGYLLDYGVCGRINEDLPLESHNCNRRSLGTSEVGKQCYWQKWENIYYGLLSLHTMLDVFEYTGLISALRLALSPLPLHRWENLSREMAKMPKVT